ncbi:MAG: ATP-dependent Clp protease ATP-binding subunit [Clostridiales bacterium]|nr:ATP-dependent Clp protease ATP-binding subunit [Candidatus Apopatousia equi]
MFYNINATEEVNEVLKNASKVAKLYNNSEIATEHLVYGILCDKKLPSCEILNSFNVFEKDFENVLKENQSEKYSIEVDLDLTPRTKQVFLVAQKLATQLGHSFVGTEHLMFSILLSDGSVAISILEEIYKINLNDLRNKLLEELKKIKVDLVNESMVIKSSLDEKLLEMGEDLTLKAKLGKIDPIIGRDKEIERIIEILCRKTKNNPILIGEPGVGKSAVVEGLALKLVNGNVPEILKDKKIYLLNLGTLMAGTKFRGALEEKLKNLIDIITKDQSIITFIDEIHTLYQAGSEKGEVNPADMLKPYLARGDMQTIGATTTEEYNKFIEKDKALERRFQPITICPPSVEDTIKILKGLKPSYENYHGVSISDEALVSAVNLSQRYITNRNLPDKAIDLVDIASSRVKIKSSEDGNTVNPQITSEDIAEVVSSWTNIPITKINETEKDKLLHFEDILHKRVIGQEEAISAVSKAIRRARVGLKDSKRPIGSFVFLGQTGVGKTELSKAIAEAMFDDENSLIRIDMSEFMEAHTVSKLIGSPPGYVGYEEGGQLTDKVRKNPYSVVLFDEVEKAHPDITNLLLQILDDGRLTDGQGRLVNFQNTIIIMTSNVGAQKMMERKNYCKENHIEFDEEKQKEFMINELKKVYRPELLNRIDLITIFSPLNVEQLAKIASLMIKNLNKKLEDKNITLKLTETALLYLIKNGANSEYGARPLRRIIEQQIEDVIAEALIEGSVSENYTVIVSMENDKLKFEYKQNN